MALGRRKRKRQEALWVNASALPDAPGHPFYERLNEVLAEHGFDDFAERSCAAFYADGVGRPSLPPGIYFRLLLIGYFEGIDSERGIAWRVADSLALRKFLGFGISNRTPEHSTLSKARHRIDVQTHQAVFDWVLKLIAKSNLLHGKTIGVDATTLEANAALRSIVRRDTGEAYDEFLTRLAKASGIETPTREDLARLDRNRPRKGSNAEWEHPHDPDAAITKMKDGRTHLAHKAEHAVDMETGAVVAVNLTGAEQGDTETLPWTVIDAQTNLQEVAADLEARKRLHEKPVSEIVGDKGYHCNDTVVALEEEGIRSYISEPNRGTRDWKGKPEARRATYANRRRIRGSRGQRLRRRRGEVLERTFAHVYDTGGMRRLHLRGRENILKRLLTHVSAFNLGLLMRKLVGKGTPRGLQGLLAATLNVILRCFGLLHRPRSLTLFENATTVPVHTRAPLLTPARSPGGCAKLSTGC